MIPALVVRGLHVALGDTPVLVGVDLEVAPGEVLALLGPSGSGKTTLLGTIAGFTVPALGEVVLDGSLVSGAGRYLPPEQRPVGVVFQSYALWPHLSALDTVAYPLRMSGVPLPEARRRASGILDALGIGDLGGRRPAELSGGQQQRVGLARALARDASLFLLDEPTAHLDPATRAAAEDLIATQRAQRGAAAIWATHDAIEALGVADRVALLREGRIAQVGTPVEVYERPVDAWAAVLTGPVSVIDLPGRGRVALRPEWVRLGGDHPGTVTAVRYRGAHTEVHLDTPFGPVQAIGDGDHRPGDPVSWGVSRVWAVG